mmetsp:Transcript_2418/g.5260  ORF Transcript_2418/g.5260 Transcript_2418/m.5260 type:complete len:164 (+) Transcript_2418:1073-1564(+)
MDGRMVPIVLRMHRLLLRRRSAVGDHGTQLRQESRGHHPTPLGDPALSHRTVSQPRRSMAHGSVHERRGQHVAVDRAAGVQQTGLWAVGDTSQLVLDSDQVDFDFVLRDVVRDTVRVVSGHLEGDMDAVCGAMERGWVRDSFAVFYGVVDTFHLLHVELQVDI